MSYVIYAGVGGTGPWDGDKYENENGPDTFVRKLQLEWPYGPAEYFRGPGAEGIGTNTTIVWRVLNFIVQTSLHEPGCKGIVLCGHSRGAAALVVAARRLMLEYFTGVDLFVALDPVNCTPSPESHYVPSNVKLMVKPMRRPDTNSRPTWGNCATLWNPLTTTVYRDTFFGTHAAIGGQVWGIESVSPAGYIHEWPEPWDTRVSLYDDEKARRQVWNYIYPNITRVCRNLLGSEAEKPVEKPIGVMPIPGAPAGPGLPQYGKREHIVSKGESLSLIAGNYWQDVLLWPILWKANKAKVPNPNLIEVGQRLTVPSIAGLTKPELDQARNEGRNWR